MSFGSPNPIKSSDQNTESSLIGGHFHHALLRLQRLVNRVRRNRGEDGRGVAPTVICYYGYGSDSEVVLRGRVVRDPHRWKALKDDSAWRNFRGMAGNWFTDEVPFARVTVTYEGLSKDCQCDKEGYFTATLSLPEGREPGEVLWQPYTASLTAGGELSEGKVEFFPTSAKRIVISDIDDTVIETGASQLWQMIKTTLLQNIHTRKIFPGVSKFYQALQNGAGGNERNPFYYVTSSPWNLRAFIMSVFESRGTPQGPGFMTAWGLDETKIVKTGHGKHKLAAITRLLEFYAPHRAILIGDSGERDPEIYTELVERFPGRIEALFIRDVTIGERERDVESLIARCRKDQVELHLVPDTASAVAIAEANGFIAKAR